MGTPFLAEIKICTFGFAPEGWALCNGSLLPINQNQALFSLMGTAFGGNGQTNFALPDLRGRVPVHMGAGLVFGQAGGQTAHTVTQSEMPAHYHPMQGHTETPTFVAANASPAGKTFAQSQVKLQSGALVSANLYGPPANFTALASTAVTNAGGSQAHSNMMPYLTLNFCVALEGMLNDDPPPEEP